LKESLEREERDDGVWNWISLVAGRDSSMETSIRRIGTLEFFVVTDPAVVEV